MLFDEPATHGSRTPTARCAEVAQTTLVFNGLFRGQQLRVASDVQLHLRADVTVDRFPAPAKASVAVQASRETHLRFGDGHGAVAIVLDASGSMGPARGQPFSPTTKYAEATRALREVLERLPQGTLVSLWVFGQALGSQKSAPDAERTIRRVLPPTRWNPGDQGQLQSLMARVEYPAIEPWNESPIVEAMLAAKGDLLDASGFKTLVVITDGMDNRFAKALSNAATAPSAEAASSRDIPQALTEGFANTGIAVEVVGFKIVNAEEAEARRQFQVIENFFPPGRLTRVTQTPALVAALDTALRQRLRYWVENYDNTLVAATPQRGLEVGRGGGEQWLPGGLAPGGYLVRTHTNRLLQKAIALNRGDLLLLRLAESADGPQLQRAPYAAGEFSWKPFQAAADWRLTALQNQRVNQHGLQMLLALEKSPSPAATTLEQIRPNETWIEVTPAGKTIGQAAVAWSEVYGYPAPAFSVESPRWPTPVAGGVSSPLVRVWWSPDRQAPAACALRRGREFQTLGELAGTSLRVGGEDVTLESVAVETHVLETQPGRREPQPCLVVRLAHTPGQKLLVRPEGLALGGREHRFYSSIGRYTGLFWPVTSDEAATALSELGVISVDAFKLEAQRRGYALQLNKLSPPQPTDMRPRPAFAFER